MDKQKFKLIIAARCYMDRNGNSHHSAIWWLNSPLKWNAQMTIIHEVNPGISDQSIANAAIDKLIDVGLLPTRLRPTEPLGAYAPRIGLEYDVVATRVKSRRALKWT